MAKKVQQPVVCHGHSRPIVEVQYSLVTSDGYFLASASKDGQPMIRMGDTGDWVGTFLGHKGAVWSCQLNNAALLAATGSADFTARVWDATTGDELHQFAHKHIVRTVAFADDGFRLATGGMEKCVRVYDIQQPTAAPLELPKCDAGIRCIAWCQNDTVMLTSEVDKPNIKVWDVRSLTCVKTLETKAAVLSIEASEDKTHITTADGQSVKVWSGESLEVVKDMTFPYLVESASLCLEKRRLVAGGSDMWVHLYNYDTGDEVDIGKGHHGPVHAVRFSPNGQSFASGSEDGTIRIWETDFCVTDDQPPAKAPEAVASPVVIAAAN